MRRHLPHVRDPGHIQHIIFCTLGAYSGASPPKDHPDRLALADRLLDASPHGRILIGAAADAVADTLRRRAPEDYDLYAWCVMPNHVHVLAAPRKPLTLNLIVQAWKSVSARAINAHLGRRGSVWQADYFDRYMRDEGQLETTASYIEKNPVTAKLVTTPHEWRWSSAAR